MRKTGTRRDQTERINERPADPAEAADRPLEQKEPHDEVRPDDEREPHSRLNHPVDEPDPTADSDPYAPADDPPPPGRSRGPGPEPEGS